MNEDAEKGHREISCQDAQPHRREANSPLRRDNHHTVEDLLLGTALPPRGLTLGLGFRPWTSSFSRSHWLVDLVSPLDWLGVDLHSLVASIHKRPAGLVLRLSQTGTERFHSQICKVFGKESSISLRYLPEVIVTVLAVLRMVCITRWVNRSIRDKRPREVKVLLEWGRR